MTNLMEQARQGDPKAIAALMNRSTEPKGISVKASREGNCLQVLMEGDTVPARDATLSFVRQGMQNLGIDSITIVKVFGRQVGQDNPVWQEDIILNEAVPTAAPMQPLSPSMDHFDDEDLLPDDPLDDDFYRDDAPQSLDDGAYFDEDDYGDSTPSDVPHLPNESITDFVDEDPDTYGDDPDDDSLDTDTAIDTNPKKEKQSSGLLLSLLAFLALVLGGYYIYSQKPEVLTSLPVVGDLIPGLGGTGGETPAATSGTTAKPAAETAQAPASDAAKPEATQEATQEAMQAANGTGDATTQAPAGDPAAPKSNAAPPNAPPKEAADATPSTEVSKGEPAAAPNAPAPQAAGADSFREAVNAAMKAAQLTQSAQTPEDWAVIVSLWDTAIAQMAAVPSDSPNYQTAQDRLGSYPANRDYAKQKAGQ